MAFLADLHLHSHFSRATSQACRPRPLAEAAARKGLALIGSGDCTHAGWRDELAGELVEAEDGLYRLRQAAGPEAGVRFLITGEISCIYKQGDRTRKIHHLVLFPSLAGAARASDRLEARGANLRSDGRPIIGLDSRTLLALILDAEPGAILIPAHIWTPHFSLFGANSGFDRLEDCFGDLAGEIKAYETGLSSDPPMNWRLSVLDRLTLISNSDAHSPEKLGREANEIEAELSFPGLAGALHGRNGSVRGTIEFFPEEGKYHFDGHRNCGVCWHPDETRAASGLCRVCGRPVTIGVLHRVHLLADRAEGYHPEKAPEFTTLVPLIEVLAEALEVGTASRRVAELHEILIQNLGPEIPLLRQGNLAEVARLAGPLVSEAMARVRAGKLRFEPGYDGQYGKVQILRPEERRQLSGQAALFATTGLDLAVARQQRGASHTAAAETAAAAAETVPGFIPGGLSPEQAAVVEAAGGPLVVIAGPGTGKTRTLISRLAYLLSQGARPETITAITFTHRAADEIRRRLEATAGPAARGVWVGTFHRFCLDLITAARGGSPIILDENEAAEVLAEAAAGQESARGEGANLTAQISLLKGKGLRPEDYGVPPGLAEVYRRYQERLAGLEAFDLDDLLLEAIALLSSDETIRSAATGWAGHLLVDEFQDVNAVQYQLVKTLAGDGAGLMVIGDPDQAIYGFRGAGSGYFERLLADFPGAFRHELRLNYRSTATIARAAGALFPGRRNLAAGVRGPKIRYLAAAKPGAEAKAIIREIELLVGGTWMLASDQQSGRAPSRAYSLGEIAILFRTGRQAQPIEEALFAAGIPYRLLSRRTLLDDPSIREALVIMRYLEQPSLLRLILALRDSRFNPGREARRLLEEEARKAVPGGGALAAVREMLGRGDFTIEAHEKLQAFLDFSADLSTLTNSLSAAEMLLRAAVPPGQEVPRALRQAAKAAGGRSVAEFLLRLRTGQEADFERREDQARPGEGVSLLTMHAAKGLEFPAVILAGLAEGIIPSRRAGSEEELAEERRLFYVAMTRAAESLILSGPAQGTTVPAPSRYLAELPPDLYERVGAKTRRKNGRQPGLFDQDEIGS